MASMSNECLQDDENAARFRIAVMRLEFLLKALDIALNRETGSLMPLVRQIGMATERIVMTRKALDLPSPVAEARDKAD